MESPMPNDTRYRINRPKVILESFDDEVVIVNLDTGNYYSIDSVGAAVWGWVEHGATVVETVEGLIVAYDGERADIELGVDRFVDELIQNNLIVPAEGATLAEAKTPTQTATRKPFTSPMLNKYSDMQELLLLDPIHEVDETGWPSIAIDPHANDDTAQ
jgi:Coenzyme PQQ synthesis protein D (PqqD)